MIQFSILFNKRKMQKLIEAAEKGKDSLKSAHPAMQKISIFLDRWVQQNFKSEGGKVGGWEPFKYGGRLVTKTKTSSSGKKRRNKRANAQSIEMRRHIDASAKLLQDTGALRASYRPFATNFAAGIGSDLPYAKTHEKGEGPVPQRRTLPEDRDVRESIRDILEGYVEDSVAKKFKSAFNSD